MGSGSLSRGACVTRSSLYRDQNLTAMAMAFFFASVHSLALPIQWTEPVPSVSSTPEEGMSESDETQANRVYHWLLALQFVCGVANPPEPLRRGFHRTVVVVPTAVVWASSVVYPMDWGRWYQDWPLPTVYASVVAFLLSQGVAVVGWKMLRRGGDADGDDD